MERSPHGSAGDPPHGPGGLEFPPLVELVPHRPPMLLLDALTAVEDTAVAVRATIRAGDPFVDGDRASALLAVELFAQAVAALFAYKSRGGDTPFSGVLLGARDLELLVPFLHVGDTLDVSCRETWASGPVAQYTCTLHRGPERLAGGSITVLRGDLAEGPQDALA